MKVSLLLPLSFKIDLQLEVSYIVEFSNQEAH